MELVDLILSSVEFGMVHSLLLLLLNPEDLNTDELIEERVNGYMKTFKGHRDWIEIKKFVQLVYNDKFSKETYRRPQNYLLLDRLEKLRNNILDFFSTTIQDLLKNDKELERVCDVDLKMGKYLLQLFRLRMVIQPQYGLSITTNPKSEVQYMNVKSYWKDRDNKSERKFNKSLGLASNYPDGIKDEKALEDGLNLIQEVMLEEYLKEYPD
jgi:hypothetical protein